RCTHNCCEVCPRRSASLKHSPNPNHRKTCHKKAQKTQNERNKWKHFCDFCASLWLFLFGASIVTTLSRRKVTHETHRVRGYFVCTDDDARGAVAEVSHARRPAYCKRQAESHRARATHRGRQARPVGDLAKDLGQIFG